MTTANKNARLEYSSAIRMTASSVENIRRNAGITAMQITISTAGGPTGDALAAGGVDAACLPEEDCEAREADAFPVLAAPGRVLAVTGAREELDGDFRAALAEALLETEEGAAFLSLYSPDTVYTAAP